MGYALIYFGIGKVLCRMLDEFYITCDLICLPNELPAFAYFARFTAHWSDGEEPRSWKQ